MTHPTAEMERVALLSDADLKAISERAEKATPGPLLANLHHTQDYAGRTHAMIVDQKSLVPLAAVVLGVGGCSQDEGRANARLFAAARTDIMCLLAHIAALSRPQVAGMNDALTVMKQAAAWFQEYADEHRAKGDDEKAARNQKRADYLRNSIAGVARPQVAEWRHIEELMKEVRIMGATQPSYIGTRKKINELLDAIRRLAAAHSTLQVTEWNRAIAAAAHLAEEGCFDIGCTMSEATGVVRRTRDSIAADIRALAAAPSTEMGDVHKPYAYAYRYPHHGGGTVVRFDTGGREINGSKPIETIPLYLHPAPAPPDAVAELMRPFKYWLGHIEATGSRRLEDSEVTETTGRPTMGALRKLIAYAATLAAGGK